LGMMGLSVTSHCIMCNMGGPFEQFVLASGKGPERGTKSGSGHQG